MNRRFGKELTPEESEKKSRTVYWWLLVVIFFEYARPASYFPPLGILPLNSMLPLLLFVVSFFAPGLRSWQDIRKDRMWVWPFIFVAAVLVSMSWASVQTYAFNTFKLILGYLFLFIMIVRIVTTMERLRGVFLTLIVAHVFLIIMNPDVVTDPNTRHYISGATFLGDGNDFSMSLCILIALAIELALRERAKWKRMAYWGLLGIVMLAIIGTQSRGASLGLGAVLGYLWWRSPRKAVGIAAISVAVVGLLFYAPSIYFQRMGTLANTQEEGSAQGRIMAWKAGTRMAMGNVLGVGAGNFPNNFPKYRSADAPVRWMTAHSMYFLILGELGVLGLLMWLKLLLGNIFSNNRLRKRLENSEKAATPMFKANIRTLDMLNASVIGMIVAGAFLSVTYYPHIFMVTSLLISARVILSKECEVNLSDVDAGNRINKRRRVHVGT
jgi:putative inorganic carbon (HCO3(-)) transporter